MHTAIVLGIWTMYATQHGPSLEGGLTSSSVAGAAVGPSSFAEGAVADTVRRRLLVLLDLPVRRAQA